MSQQEQINALRDENLCLKDEISILKIQLKNSIDENVSLVEEIDSIKAQVNCLRKALKILDRNSKAQEALEATPEQCLAEVKAKAIEDYKNQLAESKQLDLATKIMTVTI